MNLRELSIMEQFPLAIKQDLLKKQSEHLVKQLPLKNGLEGLYVDMPTECVLEKTLTPLQIDSKPPSYLLGVYVKNHWRALLVTFVVGGLLVNAFQKLNERNDKKKIP